ncbi:response regulator receiver domain [Flectobacillus roseus]
MYSQKAFEILNSSINSAVFIDEKAKDFYTGTPIDNNIVEEVLSEGLFKTFRDNGKSLAVHKFEAMNLQNPQILDYLFKGRDLILLDWELSELGGQQYSLELLSKAVGTPNINFCCIYSSSSNFNDIPLFLDAYFSGLSENEFETIKVTYDYIEPHEIQQCWNEGINIVEFFKKNGIDALSFPIERIREKPVELILRYIYIAFVRERFIVPELPNDNYEVLNSGNNSFIINNTFVLTLKKDLNEDSDCKILLRRISDAVVENKGSFFQLLGLEMQSIFNSNERFIDETILKSSTEALFQFRNHLQDDKTFAIIIKKLLLEHATLKLRTAELELLKTDFLDFKSNELINRLPRKEDLFQLNVFYNAVSVRSLHSDDIPNLNFGDVFKGNDKDYYLCITALCDCYRPKEGNFYFAKGSEFPDLELALKLGDTAFLSFLPNGKVVLWGDKESIERQEKIRKLEGESEEDFQSRKEKEKLEFEVRAYKKFLYKPFLIRPKVYNVENNKLIDRKIKIWDITNNYRGKHELNYYDVEYITTLRSDYAQRIANHAFGHPSRVGVDFVKI